jgi:hypothetical protein
MNVNDSPITRADAGSRVYFKTERNNDKPSAIDSEADTAAILFPLPAPVARILAALANLRRALG